MKVGILRFPGTNCDRDTWAAAEQLGWRPEWLWHQDSFEGTGFDLVLVPGGFSYGDYLRSGALAARSSAVKSLHEAARRGVKILGICNGFQILCEAGLLPGALLRNQGLRFIDQWADLKVESRGWRGPQQIRLPIAHGDGRYFISQENLEELQERDQIWIRYQSNPNGSLGDIAGVRAGGVGGLMPHPERAMADWMGGVDGVEFLKCFAEAL